MQALVTGASRGIGRGIATALAREGCSVVVTGRDAKRLDELRAQIEASGGRCMPYPCDHSDFEQTVSTFERLGSLDFDLVVNNAWGGYEKMVEEGQYTWERKFWDQPLHRWGSMMDVGVRTAFLASKYGARHLIESRGGAIVNISFWAARIYMQNVLYGVAKAAIDKLSHDMAVELKEYGVPVISLYPGLVRTEAVLENASYFDMTNSESPEFSGLVTARFAQDPRRMEDSGGFLTTAELGHRYGLSDVDGKVIQENRLA